MAAPNIGDCISLGFAGLKKNPVTYILGFVLMSIINSMTFGILLGPLWVGYFKMVKIDDEGGQAQIGDLFKGFDDFVPGLVAGILSSIIIGIGTLLCFIPGILAAPILPISLYLVANGEKDGVKAVTRAWKALTANLVHAVVGGLVLGIIGMSGLILCCIGVLFTIPMVFIGNYHLSKQITDGGTVQ